MVKITRTSTKYPPPPKSFYLMVMLLFVFPAFPRSTGTPLLPQPGSVLVAASARGRLHRFFSRGKETFSTEFSGNCTVVTLEYFLSHLLSTAARTSPSFAPSRHLPFKGKLEYVTVRTWQVRHKQNSGGQILQDGKEIYRC